MHIDFLINDIDLNDQKIKDFIPKIISSNIVNTITIPHYLIKIVKPIIPHNIEISCLIDYPIGVSDLKTRQFAADQALKSNVTCLDVAMPQNFASNRKYDKIREDLKNLTDLAKDKNAKVRYLLEYRFFDHNCLKKICEIFESFEIKYAFPSSGYFIDNLADNIIASIFLYKNSKDLNILCSGNIWHEHHFETLLKSGLFGFRTSSLAALQNFARFNISKEKNNGV